MLYVASWAGYLELLGAFIFIFNENALLNAEQEKESIIRVRME